MRKPVRHSFTKTRCSSHLLLAIFLFVSPAAIAARANDSSGSHAVAKAQFERAEQARTALELRPEKSRSLKEYVSLVGEYRRVTFTTPRAPEVPVSFNEMAALYRTMGDLFDAKYYNQAIDTYKYLLREYPTSEFREDALLAIARIQQDDLNAPALAHETYDEFLTQHPHSSHLKEVRAALEDLAKQDRAVASAGVKAPLPMNPAAPKGNIQDSGRDERPEKIAAVSDRQRSSSSVQDHADTSSTDPQAQMTHVRTWNADTYSRIIIDVGSKVKYQAARITGPDRIYFDIETSKVSSLLLHKPIEVGGGGFIKGVRVAQYQPGVARVVLEVNHAKDFSAFLLPDPYRLVIDVFGASPAVSETTVSPAPPSVPNPAISTTPPVESTAKKVVQPLSQDSLKSASAQQAVLSVAKGLPLYSTLPSPPAEGRTDQLDPPVKTPMAVRQVGVQSASTTSATKKTLIAVPPPLYSPLPLPSAAGRTNLFLPTAQMLSASEKKSPANSKSAKEMAAEMGPASVPEPMLSGQRSLSRALGLKIGRIVIDAGHGGHDTGTIGPTGLMEKDLCLDVSLRLGKLIAQRLPGADVVLTREDDTFVPLEERTSIANNARADLFVSIHANSSPDRSARGIETYYLNFNGSANAMEVAARENATSENSVHDLQDIVEKIARNEKIEESRDLASNIQNSLAQRTAELGRGEHNRGVRKAPFVVLIGADMPSVLAEISFLSNPSDEQLLKKPENRQRIAEGLYRGIEKYLQSTNSLANNLKSTAAVAHAGIVARSANTQ
jgi:N-acetylmuramoyl-L-alanine amidase